MLLARVCKAIISPEVISLLKAPVMAQVSRVQVARLLGKEERNLFSRQHVGGTLYVKMQLIIHVAESPTRTRKKRGKPTETLRDNGDGIPWLPIMAVAYMHSVRVSSVPDSDSEEDSSVSSSDREEDLSASDSGASDYEGGDD